ncbi:viral late transcription factor [Pteropox virus]|uniref:Viral late gene transcription factor 2 n=1 Tax=Pteropox virus TaxID=1873698 RepID=A0A1B1MRG8_9POXV|nr:viral late transcription factor [Pteropox virus]ANS71178.1 viral late transcription factor [Pteropox virus]
MAKRVSLPNVVINAPKAAIKSTYKESLGCVLPSYYKTLNDSILSLNTKSDCCWFCNQQLDGKYLSIETLMNSFVGYFCSRICRDSFACMVKTHIALREEPKISLLPLTCYKDPEKVIKIINECKEEEGLYGNCFFNEKTNTIQMSLRSLY